ncbi:MAG: 30S ribosomal protein S5 [Puniceicoccales bacterium]|jgi:small subunit ribosomal protein S5|nr:30S ribosomal protein S5 [Puniceicoccales bacterium]
MMNEQGSGGRERRRRERVDRRVPREREAGKLVDKLIHINRCAKVVKGGRRFNFSALVVVGDRAGRAGLGKGKSKEVSDAVRKATERAKQNLRAYALREATIPHSVEGRADGGRVILRPASPGTGVIAGGSVRHVLEVLGVKNILSKSLGSSNPASVVHATLNALSQLRTLEQVQALRCAVPDGVH